MPKTKLGKWSFWSAVVVVISMIVFLLSMTLAAKGENKDSIDFSKPLEVLPLLPLAIAGLCGIVASVTGLIGIIKSNERSVLVFITTLVGLFISFLLIGELLSAVGVLPGH